jgi:hypothetical protein
MHNHGKDSAKHFGPAYKRLSWAWKTRVFDFTKEELPGSDE